MMQSLLWRQRARASRMSLHEEGIAAVAWVCVEGSVGSWFNGGGVGAGQC